MKCKKCGEKMEIRWIETQGGNAFLSLFRHTYVKICYCKVNECEDKGKVFVGFKGE